jgi:hypothetical protein
VLPPAFCATVFSGIDLVSLPSSGWHLLLPYNGSIAFVVLTYLRCCTGVIALVTLVSLPSQLWHCCPHCAGIIAIITLASLPLLRWHCCPCRTGIITFVELVFFSGTMLASIALVALASLF